MAQSCNISPLLCAFAPLREIFFRVSLQPHDRALLWRATERALVVGSPVWLPTNREPGANPGRPRRCKRAQARSILFEAIIGAFGLGD